MKVLIVDDNENKVESIIEALNNLGITEIKVKSSKNEAMKELVMSNDTYDLLVLDMNFPLYDNEYPEKDMGIEVLKELEGIIKLNKATKKLKVIICSSEEQKNLHYYEKVIGNIMYNPFVCLEYDFEKILEKNNINY